MVIALLFGCAQTAEMFSIKPFQLGIGPCHSVRRKILAACHKISIDSSEVVTGRFDFTFSSLKLDEAFQGIYLPFHRTTSNV